MPAPEEAGMAHGTAAQSTLHYASELSHNYDIEHSHLQLLVANLLAQCGQTF
jgi:hypothetical protein